jgi:hypothetical protein
MYDCAEELESWWAKKWWKDCFERQADGVFLRSFGSRSEAFSLFNFVVPELGEGRYGVTQGVEPGVR